MFKKPCRKSNLLKNLKFALCIFLLCCKVKCTEQEGNAVDRKRALHYKYKFNNTRKNFIKTPILNEECNITKYRLLGRNDFLQRFHQYDDFPRNYPSYQCYKKQYYTSNKQRNCSKLHQATINNKPVNCKLLSPFPVKNSKCSCFYEDALGKSYPFSVEKVRCLRRTAKTSFTSTPISKEINSVDFGMMPKNESSNNSSNYNLNDDYKQIKSVFCLTTNQVGTNENISNDPLAEYVTEECIKELCQESLAEENPDTYSLECDSEKSDFTSSVSIHCTETCCTESLCSTQTPHLIIKENSNKRSITLLLVSMICPQVRNKIKQCIPWLATTTSQPSLCELLHRNPDSSNKAKSHLQKIFGWFT